MSTIYTTNTKIIFQVTVENNPCRICGDEIGITDVDWAIIISNCPCLVRFNSGSWSVVRGALHLREGCQRHHQCQQQDDE